MKNNQKSTLIIAIAILLVVAISIGYAALTSTLNINGTAGISKVTWDVHFETIAVTSGSVTATTPPTITGTTTVSYALTLPTPGSFYEFTVNVKNAGSLPAKLASTPTMSGVSTAQDVYTNYTVKYSDGSTPAANNTLAAGASKTLKIRVEYDKNITNSQLPTAAQSLTLTYSMNYIQG